MNHAIDRLLTFRELTRATCLVCMGRGFVPVTAREKFTGQLKTNHLPCLRCHGSGRVQVN